MRSKLLVRVIVRLMLMTGMIMIVLMTGAVVVFMRVGVLMRMAVFQVAVAVFVVVSVGVRVFVFILHIASGYRGGTKKARGFHFRGPSL